MRSSSFYSFDDIVDKLDDELAVLSMFEVHGLSHIPLFTVLVSNLSQFSALLVK